MNKILNNEITDSFRDIMKKRLTSPIYGIFLISWIIFHWNFIFTIFFVSEDKIWNATGLLKNEYLEKTYFDFMNFKFYILWILPFIITYFIIWWFPKWISIPAFKKDEEYKTQKRIIEIIEKKKLEEENVKKLEVITRRTQKEREVKEQEKKIEKIDPTVKWQMEYAHQFRGKPFYGKFRYIIDSIYKYNGDIAVENEYGQGFKFEIPRDILVFSHTNDLITIDKKEGKIELTEKGKFFVKQFSSENQI